MKRILGLTLAAALTSMSMSAMAAAPAKDDSAAPVKKADPKTVDANTTQAVKTTTKASKTTTKAKAVKGNAAAKTGAGGSAKMEGGE